MLQRRSMLLRTSLKVKKDSFESVASRFASVSANALHIVSERLAWGDFTTFHNDEERMALNLMREVKAVTSHVEGSAASKMVMRNELRALMLDQGLPSFYLTINPSDTRNPLV
ncbi:hypothetical protein C8J56DRAFT_797612, partial [Mycena floridula]